MDAFHLASLKSKAVMLRDGLAYGTTGIFNDDRAKRVNLYLDMQRPEYFNPRVSRQHCLYVYYAPTLDTVHDITDGTNRSLNDWIASNKDKAVFRVRCDETAAYVSDLDAYDACAEALESNQPEDVCKKRAQVYWSRVIPYKDFAEFYKLQHDDFQLKTTARPDLPKTFSRIEIMLLKDIHPDQLEALA